MQFFGQRFGHNADQDIESVSLDHDVVVNLEVGSEHRDDLHDIEIFIEHSVFEFLGGFFGKGLREHDDDGDLCVAVFLCERAQPADFFIFDAVRCRVDAIPDAVNGLIDIPRRKAFAYRGEDFIFDFFLSIFAEFEASRVVDCEWDTFFGNPPHVVGDGFPEPGLGELFPENAVDERAFPDAGLSRDDDVERVEIFNFVRNCPDTGFRDLIDIHDVLRGKQPPITATHDYTGAFPNNPRDLRSTRLCAWAHTASDGAAYAQMRIRRALARFERMLAHIPMCKILNSG